MYIPTGFINTTEVEKSVDEFIKTLGPEVVRVRYNIGEDWMGDTVLYFRFVLADSVSADMTTFVQTAQQIRRALFDELKPLENWGLFPHANFRSNAEQTALNDPKWA